MKLSKEEYYKTVNEYAERFMGGSDRSDIFQELLKKGIEKKEASLICDLAQSTARRNKSIKEHNASLPFRGIILFVFGSLSSLFGYFIFENMESKGFYVISALTILLYILKYAGILIALFGIFVIIFHVIKKRNEKNPEKTNILDN